MADETLSWTLDFDVKTGNITSSNATLQQLVDLLGKAKKGTGDFERGLSSMTRAGLAVASIKSIFDGLRATIGAAAGALNQFGDFAVRSFESRNASLRAYSTLLGSAVKAEVEFSKAQQLALRTDLTAAQTTAAQKSLMVAGFRGGGLDRALLASMDVATMAAPEERQQTLDRMARGFSQISAKGKLQGEELMQLSEAGVSRSLVTDELRKAGITGDIDKAISGGRVSSEVGIAAIQRAIMAQFGTSKLGEFATSSQGSVSSLMSNRDEAMANLLQSVNSDSLPGVGRLKDSLVDLNEALSLDSESGKNLSLVLQQGASTVTGLQATFQDFMTGFVQSLGESFLSTMRELGVSAEGSDKNLADMATSAKSLGEVVGKVGSGVAYLSVGLEKMAPLIDGVTWALGGIGGLIGDVIDGFTLIGRVMKGMAVMATGDISGGYGQIVDASAVFRGEAKQAAGYGVLTGNPYLNFGDMGGAGVLMRPAAAGARVADAPSAPGKPRAALSGRGSGGGGGGYALEDWAPDWGGARSLLSDSVEQQIHMIAPPDYHVTITGDVRIEVHGSQDPGAVADAVMDRFMRRVGRMVRTPSARTQ